MIHSVDETRLNQLLATSFDDDAGYASQMQALNTAAHDLFPCSAIQFLSADSRTMQPIDTLISRRREALDAYVAEMAPIDPRYSRMYQWPRSVWRNTNLLSEQEYTNSQLADFLTKHEALRQVGHVRKFPDGIWFLTVLLNGANASEYDVDVEAPLARLHNVLCTMSQLRSENLSLVSPEAAYDSRAVFLDRCARVIHVGKSAEASLRSDWITIESKRLSARTRRSADLLNKALKESIAAQPGEWAPRPVVLKNKAGQFAGTVVLHCIGCRHSHDFFGMQPAVVAILKDRSLPDVSFDLLVDQLGLTPSEARLVTALAAGETLAEYALSAGVRPDTLRKSLQSVFLKLDTSSQIRLTQFLQRIADDSY